MIQFFLDVFWYGNIGFSFSLQMIVIGFVLIGACFHILFTSGMLHYKPQPIHQIQDQTRAVAFGTITAEETFEWNGIQCAYFLDSKTEKHHPANNLLYIHDASGSIPISIKDADINGTEVMEGEGSISYIEQESACFVRGYVTENRQFETTYIKQPDTPKTETDTPKTPIREHFVEIQTYSFIRNVRDGLIMMGIVISLIFVIFEAYPLYNYYHFWNRDIEDVIESKSSHRSSYSISLLEEDVSLSVRYEMYVSCQPGIRISKPAGSLDWGCGDEPDEFYIKNRPLSEQMLMNWVWFLLGIFLIAASVISMQESKKK